MKKYPTPFKWTECELCGLFRECDEIIPPQETWKVMNAEQLLTEKRFICFNCKRIEFKKRGYLGTQDLIYSKNPLIIKEESN